MSCQKLTAALSAVWSVVFWVGFKLLQASVGLGFTLFIFAQTGVAGILQAICPSKVARKAAAARQVQEAREAAAGKNPAGPGLLPAGECLVQDLAQKSPSEVDPEVQQPFHVFTDPAKGPDSLAWQLLGPYVRAYGRHAIANSQLFNPEYIHFFWPGVGSLPCVMPDGYNRVAVWAIGEPLAARVDWRPLTEAFLKEFPHAYFYHITEEYAELLHDMGFYINGCGTETTLQVQSWTYSGKTRVIRAGARAARDSGVRVRELAADELTPEMRRKLQNEVTEDWRQQKAVADRDLRVFVRHMDFDNIQLRDGVRVFVAEAFDPAEAPHSAPDPVLQGGAQNVKPPKPPRRSRSHKSTSDLSQKSDASLKSNRSVSTTSADVLARNASLDTTHSTGSIEITILETPKVPTAAQGGSTAKPGSKSSNRTKGGSMSTADTAASTDLDTAVRDKDATQLAGVAPGAGGAARGPELVGFVLLDPLCEAGEETGYVVSIQRMKGSAHAGTLKLLIEDIISNLRKEGRRELAFGFAPLFNVCDGRIFKPYIHWMYWTALYLYHCCNNVYAFKNLAYAKSRYGAGLSADKMSFNDPNVKLTHVLYAMPSYLPGWNILDFYALFTYIGIIDSPWSVYLKIVGIRKGGENL